LGLHLCSLCLTQGRTDYSNTRALPEVSRGPHEMPLVPFYRLFWVCFECGQRHRGPMIPYCPGAT
ncbi:unnamed protein product, partial [Staurois parvus]